MKSNLLSPVRPFWIKQTSTPVEAAPPAKARMETMQPSKDMTSIEADPEVDVAPTETDTTSSSLDAADVGLRKVQKGVAAILGKMTAAIKEPDRRGDLGSDIDLLKDALRADVDDATTDGVNWLTLDFGQSAKDKILPASAIDADHAPVVLISSSDAADGILTRPYGASEDLEQGGYFLLSDDASYGQDISREIVLDADTSDEDVKAMRDALVSIKADLASAGDRLDKARFPGAAPQAIGNGSPGPGDIGGEIDALLANVARDALRAQALNIMNGDSRNLKRLTNA